MLTAIKNINTTKKSALCGVDATDQNAIDKKLIEIDSTPNKSLIGANAILGASLAVCRASANTQGLPLYKVIHQLSLASRVVSSRSHSL